MSSEFPQFCFIDKALEDIDSQERNFSTKTDFSPPDIDYQELQAEMEQDRRLELDEEFEY